MLDDCLKMVLMMMLTEMTLWVDVDERDFSANFLAFSLEHYNVFCGLLKYDNTVHTQFSVQLNQLKTEICHNNGSVQQHSISHFLFFLA